MDPCGKICKKEDERHYNLENSFHMCEKVEWKSAFKHIEKSLIWLTGLWSGDTVIRARRSPYGRIRHNTVLVESVRNDRCIMVSVPEWCVQFDQVDGRGRTRSLDSLHDVTDDKTVDGFWFVPTYCDWPRSVWFQYGCKNTFRNCDGVIVRKKKIFKYSDSTNTVEYLYIGENYICAKISIPLIKIFAL